MDRRVLRDWEETVNKFIDEKIRCLKQQQVNKRKKHVLKSRVHLDNLNKMHENFVLVPADKASNNVIVVCKKYYLDVVIKELSLNNTYKEVHNNNVNVISRHFDYMAKNGIDVPEQHEQLPSFYWLPKLHKKLTVPGSLLLPTNALQNSFHHYLFLALKPYLLIINNIVMVFITILKLIAFG